MINYIAWAIIKSQTTRTKGIWEILALEASPAEEEKELTQPFTWPFPGWILHLFGLLAHWFSFYLSCLTYNYDFC